MENNQEIPLPKGYTQVSIEESIPLPKGYTEVLGETAPDVKKKEQTKPVQEAPLPGLGGVSEEPTPSPSVGQGVLRDVDRTQSAGDAFISRASDLTRTDVREPQQDGGADVMSEFILPPQNAEYTINDKKVSRSEFKDFMYDRNNAQDVFNGVSSISVKNDPEMEKFASRQVQSRETNDVWDSLKSGVITLGSSVLGAQQMVGDFLEDLTGIQPTGFAKMEKTAREESIKKLQEKAKEAQESRFQAEGDFIDLVSNGDFSEAGNMAVNTVVESGPLSLTALAATAATGNPMAGFAVLAPITTGMTYSEQMTTEDEAIKNLSDTEKYLRATAFGLAEAGSEAISGKILGRSFKLFGKGVSDMVSRISSEFGEQVATDVARSSAKKTISEIMKNYGLSMAEEGAAEGLTQLTQNLTDAFLGIREMSLDQVLEGVGNAIALGAASGGIMSTPGAVGQTVSNVSKKVLDYKLSKKNGAEELTSDAKRMAEFNKIFADNLSNIESNIELRNEAVSATPNDMVSDTETVDLVEEKKRIEKEIEGKDPVLSEDLKNRINDINSELKNKVESKKKESEAVPAKQKGRLTKFTTPQDGIVGEVTYEDGTKKELTQEEYDALEKQEGLFDVETGTQPKNIRDLYNINRDMFGQDRVKSLASAIVMDRAIAVMAKRAGISKSEMYSRLQFKKGEKAPSGALKQESPTFKSTAKEGINKIQQKSATPEQWMKMITDKGGKGTSQELEWIGLNDFLQDYKKENNVKSVPKEVVEQYINDNQIEIVEVSKGEGFVVTDIENNKQIREFNNYEDAVDFVNEQRKAGNDYSVLEKKKGGSVKYEQYTLEGGENYREVLFTLPSKSTIDRSEYYIKEMRYEGDPKTYFMAISPTMSGARKTTREAAQKDLDRFMEVLDDISAKQAEYKSSHWDEGNILAHLRINERTLPNGERVMFIEEVQSDWAQEGKRKGFKGDVDIEAIKKEYTNKITVKKDSDSYYTAYIDGIAYGSGFTEQGAKNSALNSIISQKSKSDAVVPNMPYKKTDQWVGMAMRRAMQMAAQEGFDRVAWVTGEQSADRYDLSKTIEGVERYKGDNPNEITVNITPKDQPTIQLDVSQETGKVISSPRNYEFIGKDLSDIVGKELAEDLLSSAEQKDYGALDLKVGGEGMKAFYNSILPKVSKKEAQRFDKNAKVEVVDFKGKTREFDVRETSSSYEFFVNGKKIDTIDKTGQVQNKDEATDLFLYFNPEYANLKGAGKQLSIPITPEMRMNLNSAVPLFQGEQGAMLAEDGNYIIYALTDPNVSTPLHEIAHVFEHYLTDAERKAIMKFAGTKEWSVETSEKFARGFEKYLADGIAPTAELQKIFDKFKQWMLDIYNGITGSDIDIQLNDEMRDIYDKMLGKEPVAAKTESEKVKAAKDNLNNVWEKWKQSQKNLGVAFDPKSKANEDMELLEAFLTYIKALGIKTAKDIQKAFNDFTGGEATLDDAGAEFIAEKVKPKKGETNYEKTEEMNRSIIEKASKSLFNKAKKLFMSARRTFVKYSSNTRELLKSTNDIMPVYDYFVSRLGSPGNANFIFQEAKKKIYDDLFPTLKKHLDSLIKYRRIITINESRVESNRKGLDSLGVSEMFEKAGSEAVAAFKEAVTAAMEYANVSEEQSLDAKSIKKAAIQSLKESDWYKSLSDSKKARFEKQLNEDLGFLKSENFTGKDSNGNPIGLSVARGIISDIEAVVGKKDFEKISKRANLYFDEFKKLLKKDLEKGIISQEQYDAMIGKDYSPRIFLQHIFGFDNEFVNNVDDRRLAREYSLSSDAIKTLKDGLKDLYVDDAYWELITDSEKLLAGYISSRERRYQFNDLNKKLYNTLEKLQQEYETLKSKKNKTDEELLRYKKLGNIFDAFSLKQKRGHSSVHYYKNGERVSFYMRNDIFEEWYDMRGSSSTDNKIIAFMDYMFRLPQRTLQSFATGAAAPLFFIFNAARDYIQMTVISDSYGNWTFVPLSFAKAMKDFINASIHIYKEDELYKEAMDAGISMEFLYMAEGLDLSDKISEGLLKLAEKSKLTQSGAMALRKGILALSKAGIAANRYGELGFRIAIYERIRNAEYKKIESNKDSMTNDEYMEAMQDARKKAARASADFMNFREGGLFTKKINPYFSYINAAVIGADTIAMEFRKNPSAFTFRMTQGVAFLTSTMVSFGLLMLSMFDDDEDEDEEYGVLKKYYNIIDSINPYYRNKFYIIPTGGKDENGNYNVIRIAKNPALIPLSYAMEKAMRYNLEKQIIGNDKEYDLDDLKKDAFEINYLFHEYTMPINLSPMDEKGRAVPFTEITSSLVQKNIPLSLMMISMTGYDPYTNRYISPEKKYQTELDSKYLIGWNDSEIQGFYKKIAKELNSEITPAEMKVMVEKMITRPENNPYIASVYALLDRKSKVSDIIKKDRSLVGDIANMVKKSVMIPADYVERSMDFSSSKIEDEIRKYKEEKYVISKISSTVMKDLKEKAKKGDIDLSDSGTDNLMKVKDYLSEEVDKQVGVFGEAGVNVTNKDKMEIEKKIVRGISPMLNLPIQPTQYRVPFVVDRDANVMAYRFLDEFGSLNVREDNDEFEEIMKQMFSEYTLQYGSEMSKKKFEDFVRKYEEIKNDEELLD